MLKSQTVIESIAEGAAVSDIIEYISSWIGEARELADTIDAEFFTCGLPESKEEDPHEFFKRATANFHTLEITLDWIQNAVDNAGDYILRKEKEEQEKARKLAEGQEKAAGGRRR